jgi:hypothetical protein
MPETFLEIVRLWEECRRLRCLPEAGGFGDQASWTMDAFELLDRWNRKT